MDGAPRCYKWIGRIGIVDFSFILTILPRSWCVVDVFVLVFGSVFGSVYLTVFLSISWIFHRKLRVSHSFILTALYLLFCKKWVESLLLLQILGEFQNVKFSYFAQIFQTKYHSKKKVCIATVLALTKKVTSAE